MNRKDFLALIPALSSIPFIGKDIVKQDNKIILFEPKTIEVVKEIPDNIPPVSRGYSRYNFGLQLTFNGHVVAVADMTGHCNRHSWTAEREFPAEGSCHSLDHMYGMMSEPELKITASWRDREIWRAVEAINQTYERKV